MRARHVDGFVLATATLHGQLLADAAAADVPVVLMNRLAPDYSFPSVSVDNEQGARMAVTHLARLGHTRIAHVAGPQEASTGMSRLRGFRDGMATHGLTVDEDLIAYATRYTVEEGARCCRELLARPGDFTAVAAANDMPFIDRLRPPLTTVRFPHYQLGTEAAQLLLERISGREGPVKILYLAPELVIRGSTAGRAVNPSVPHRIPGALGGPSGKRLLTGDCPRKRRSGSGDGPPVFLRSDLMRLW